MCRIDCLQNKRVCRHSGKRFRRGGRNCRQGIIFHSDGGGQYYNQDFPALTEKYGFKNSMCEFAYENGKAEHVNGVIKNNYRKHWYIQDLGQLVSAVDRAVHLYNTDKPYSSLQRQTPTSFESKDRKLATEKPAEVGF